MAAFCRARLGVSERQLGAMTWPELAHRVVLLQATTRLSVRRDLSEAAIVARIMRKENYLIGKQIDAGFWGQGSGGRAEVGWEVVRSSRRASRRGVAAAEQCEHDRIA